MRYTLSMKKFLVGFIGMGIILCTGTFFALQSPVSPKYYFDEVVTIQGEEVFLSRITNREDHIRGLSGYPGLEKNQGLLFDFGEEGVRGIWMKDMLFPIDVIWLSASSTIVFIREHFAPESYPEVVKPQEEARYVIEFPAGFVSRTKLKIGDSLFLEK